MAKIKLTKLAETKKEVFSSDKNRLLSGDLERTEFGNWDCPIVVWKDRNGNTIDDISDLENAYQERIEENNTLTENEMMIIDLLAKEDKSIWGLIVDIEAYDISLSEFYDALDKLRKKSLAFINRKEIVGLSELGCTYLPDKEKDWEV